MKKYIFMLICILLIQNACAQNNQPYRQDIKAYLNDVEIVGPVYNNGSAFNIYENYANSYVSLVNIFRLLESETVINGNVIEINSPKIGNIIITYESQTNIIINYVTKGLELRPTFTNNSIVIINNVYYIRISMVRYLISGELAQDEEKVILYTSDYERLDIPLTLNDCYLALDNQLNSDIKEDIKNSSVNELIKYHMGLGMWIRNNWIRQTNDRITKLLYDNGLRHPDDMSQIIIIGYHYYLNGINKTIQELISE